MLPEHAINHLRIRGIELHLDAARVLVHVEDFLPRGAAVRRAEDPALRVRSVWMAEASDEHDVWILRMDHKAPDLLHVAETDLLPRRSAIGRLEDAVADA